MRRLALAVGILALLAALAVAEEAGETLPWEVKVARLAAFEPGARGAAVVTLVFRERGVYGATFRLRTYAGRGGEVATLAKGVLKVDIYEPGAYNVTLEGAVPSDVVCGAPVYVEGYVLGEGESSYAVVRGEQRPFIVYYNLYVGVACPSAVYACAALVRELGGADAVAGLLEEHRQLKAKVGSLEAQLGSLAADAQALREENAKLRSELEMARRQLEEALAKKSQLEVQLEAARGEAARLQQLLDAERARSRQLQVLAYGLAAAAVAAAAVAVLLAAKRRVA
jgi:regulator of replication initiation timing